MKSSRNRNSRFLYYLNGITRALYPKNLLTLDYRDIESRMHCHNIEELNKRLNYYNQCKSPFSLNNKGSKIKDISFFSSPSMYWFDLMEYARYFPQDAHILFLFRDITHTPDLPTIVKSRPISTKQQNNKNSILLKLNKIRHFLFVNDQTPFREKNNKLIWRGAVYKGERVAFMKDFHNRSKLIDVGQHNRSNHKTPQWQVPFMSIHEQLQHKFILSIEGNDVATNTKWIMSSNSLLFMKKPKYETWFMEGRLIPNHHYIELEDNYSDLEEKVNYYIEHTEEAVQIIQNAHQWVEQFKDPYIENWLNLKVIDRYLQLSSE